MQSGPKMGARLAATQDPILDCKDDGVRITGSQSTLVGRMEIPGDIHSATNARPAVVNRIEINRPKTGPGPPRPLARLAAFMPRSGKRLRAATNESVKNEPGKLPS